MTGVSMRTKTDNYIHVRALPVSGLLLEGFGRYTTALSVVVSFPDPAFKLDKGLAHFARNLGLADSALPEIWRTNQIAYTC